MRARGGQDPVRQVGIVDRARQRQRTDQGREDRQRPVVRTVRIVRTVCIVGTRREAAPSFVQYLNDRDVTRAPNAAAVAAGMDLGPEGIAFISAADSPDGKPRLVVGSEVSGTTSVYDITVTPLR